MSLATTIGLGLAKPKEYENIALQRIAMENAARAKRAKRQQELSDKWEKEFVLKTDDFKGLFPAQVEGVKNITQQAFEDFMQAKKSNPNGFASAAMNIANQLQADIQTIKERGTAYGELLERENLMPEQEQVVNELRNRLYGNDYGQLADFFTTLQPHERGLYESEVASEMLVMPEIMQQGTATKGISDLFKQQQSLLEQRISHYPISDTEYTAFTTTGKTPEGAITDVAETLWATPGYKDYFREQQAAKGTYDPNRTDEEQFGEFKEFVRTFAPQERKTTIKGKAGDFSIDFAGGGVREKLTDIGMQKDSSGKVVRHGRDKAGDREETYEADVFSVTPVPGTITLSDQVIDMSTGRPIEGTGEVEVKITKFGSFPMYNPYQTEAYGTDGEKGTVKMDNLIVTTDFMERDKGKYNYKLGVEGVATIKTMKGGKQVEVEVPVLAPMSSFGEDGFIKTAGSREQRERRATQLKGLREYIKQQNAELEGVSTTGTGKFDDL